MASPSEAKPSPLTMATLFGVGAGGYLENYDKPYKYNASHTRTSEVIQVLPETIQVLRKPYKYPRSCKAKSGPGGGAPGPIVEAMS